MLYELKLAFVVLVAVLSTFFSTMITLSVGIGCVVLTGWLAAAEYAKKPHERDTLTTRRVAQARK